MKAGDTTGLTTTAIRESRLPVHQCLPNDFLPIGKEVFVHNRKGVVVEARAENDQHGFPITVHRIRYTHKRGPGPAYAWQPIEPFERDCNYSFIYYQ